MTKKAALPPPPRTYGFKVTKPNEECFQTDYYSMYTRTLDQFGYLNWSYLTVIVFIAS